MPIPKDIDSDDTEYPYDKDNDSYILSIVKAYDEFMEDVLVSGVPMWVLCYYEGLPEAYTNNTDDNRQQD